MPSRISLTLCFVQSIQSELLALQKTIYLIGIYRPLFNLMCFISPDDAVITGHTVIPLPKLPSTFDEDRSPDYPEYEAPLSPTYNIPSPVVPKTSPVAETSQRQSPMSTLERYRTRTRPSRIQTTLDYKNEEKFVLDKAQPEVLNKQVRNKRSTWEYFLAWRSCVAYNYFN